MKHALKKSNTWYAALTVPPDVRPIIGKARFFKSTQTESATKAAPRVALLVSQWQAEIDKARGSLPDPKDDFWQALRRQYTATTDEGTLQAIEEIAEAEAKKAGDPDLYLIATDQQGTLLAPLLEDWRGSMAKLKPKTVDQRHRDVSKMAAHFGSVEKLKPQAVKAWTDKLVKDGASAVTMERMMEGCRSLWRYLQDASVVPVDAHDPFAGAGRLAIKTAKRNTVERLEFTPKEVARVYLQAIESGDKPLADLIALGAYSGARIEELCSLTTAECARGAFAITDAKTKAGIRQVPIHRALSKLVKTMAKASTDGYLVPSTAAGKYGVRSDPLSKRFGRLKTSLGFGPGYVFHSLRHGVITQMQQAGVLSPIISDVVGHETGVFTFDKYGSGSSMKQKAEALSKVVYPGALGKP
jgi:site-specific recombinase XerD